MNAQISRAGRWMQTLSGGEFYPMDPRPEEVCIIDIAGALSKLCRYGGHCLRFYSVAEHSVLIAYAAPKELQFTALLHDASEAYLGDIPWPVKPFLTGYASIEDRLMQVIAAKFGIIWPLPDEVKRLDSAIVAAERDQNMSVPPRDWGLVDEPLDVKLQFWPPDLAKMHFLNAFYRFGGKL